MDRDEVIGFWGAISGAILTLNNKTLCEIQVQLNEWITEQLETPPTPTKQ